MIFPENHALLPKAYRFSRSASVWLEKVALYWNGEDTSSTPGHGGSDQPQASLRLACRGRSWENEALGIRPRDATANLLIVDSVDHGIRQQYQTIAEDTNLSPLRIKKRSHKLLGSGSVRLWTVRKRLPK